MNTFTLTESTWGTLTLTDDDADALRALGRQLARDSTWWGSDPDEEPELRTIIRCERLSGDVHQVRVTDAVGIIGLPTTEIAVTPKIDSSHLLYLLGLSDQVPRVADQPTRVAPEQNFRNLICAWYVRATEALLHRDLLRDYERMTDELTAVRGKIAVLPTAKAVMAGRALVTCEFDEFDYDSPLNRVLHAAARVVAEQRTLESQLRRRAARVRSRIGPVTELRAHDLRVRPDARSAYYSDPHSLALVVLRAHGQHIHVGAQPAQTFLFRTPEAVERGLRRLLADGLRELCTVDNTALTLAGSRRRTLHPDLVFAGGAAVGDVKYTIFTGDLKRTHLNQLATFAAGHRCKRALLIAFGDASISEHVHVGEIRIDTLNFDALSSPEDAGRTLVEGVRDWFGEVRSL